MLKNYLKTALRHLTRNKSYASINIIGLALGITVCLLSFLVVKFELSFDSYHSKADRIYRVVNHLEKPEGTMYMGRSAYNLGKNIRNDFPELEQVSQIHYDWGGMVKVTEKGKEPTPYQEDGVIFAEPSFLKVFDFQWVEGNPSTALAEPNVVVLTEELAEKYFKEEPAIGKVINYKNKVDLKVTGVVKNAPANTHLPFSMLVSYITFKDFAPEHYDKSGIWAGSTYVLLPTTYSPGQIEKRFDSFKKKYLNAEDAQMTTYFLQPLTDIHTDNRYINLTRTLDMKVVWMLVTLGLFILITACVNFTNLATAQVITRSKEVGIRKVLGSSRLLLVRQFMTETAVFTLVAVVVSMLLAVYTLPYLNEFLGWEMELNYFTDSTILLFLILTIGVVSILAGLYPALVLSGYKPVQALKNKITTRNAGNLSLRRSLVVLQFVISQILIIGTIVIAAQMDYFRNRPLGFAKEAHLVLSLPENDKSKLTFLKNELAKNPHIESVTFASGAPITWNFYHSDFFLKEAADTKYPVEIKFVDADYLKTFDLQLIAGEKITIERDSIYQYIVNEALIKKLNYKRPEEAIGKIITAGNIEATIVGVIKDFHNNSLQHEISPLVLAYSPDKFVQGIVKISSSRVPETTRYIEKVWNTTYPEHLYGAEFLDEFLNKQYNAENRQFQLFRVMSVLAIIIGCLGLYGLVSFMTLQRTKEIGIRKVLGASVASIILLFSKEFMALIVVAFLIAAPIAWYVMNSWLQDFTYHISISAVVFIISLSISIAVALLTVGYKAINAALANPVNSLRSE